VKQNNQPSHINFVHAKFQSWSHKIVQHFTCTFHSLLQLHHGTLSMVVTNFGTQH